MHSSGEALINEGHTLWCDEAADTLRAARSKTLLVSKLHETISTYLRKGIAVTTR